ncbi:MAG: maltose ABC transporter permease MalF [Candidatus Acetothermia bacterium]|jgi:maltose/maltodextrin transport system permease protein/arabinogalactan oligomer/maltooligosaccharide transport system permease protein|nr:maltose ABC transporter permease MalF [Candidatus Acetothermia bacterium]MDH7505881.1 maltose ABC transporter permease MalF [Candidatus Acetothermia bacterium]
MIWTALLSTGLKIVLLGILDAISVWAAVSLGTSGSYSFLAGLVIGVIIINYLALSTKAYPFRYLFPGLVFLGAMVVYPIGYTVYISLTNLQTGNFLTKAQVIAQLDGRYYLPPDYESFRFWAYRNDQGALRVILIAGDGRAFISEGDRLKSVDLDEPQFERSPGGIVERFDGYRRISGPELYQNLSLLERLNLQYGDYTVRLANLNEFRSYRKQYQYFPGEDKLVDIQTGKVYYSKEGYFTAEDGTRIEPGFRVNIGLRNFISVLTSPTIRKDFTRVFTWTILWSLFTVLFSFAVGLGFAMLLNDPYIRARFLYRSLLIIPYTMPAFISALVWAGMFNTDLGVINRILGNLFGLKINWLNDPFWAKVTLIFINVWLTYPYMMIVSLGALQSIPVELFEAARVDGARGWQQFWKITMPLLLVSVAPLLIGSFAFTFNNFTIIWLVTAGRPAVLGAATPAGATDILISWTYRLAFEGAQGNQLGLASAVSIIIFIIIAAISAVNFRFTKALEEVSQGV